MNGSSGQSLAPAESTLGRLQRGRGSGWLRAAGSASGGDDLRECLRQDPRWDRQVESRSRYYATLALEMRLDADDLYSEMDFDPGDGLAVGVLTYLGGRGSRVAVELLRGTEAARDRPAPRGGEPAPAARRTPPWPDADAPIEQLLAHVGGGAIPRAWRHRFRFSTEASDLDAIRSAGSDPDSTGWRTALVALGLRKDPSAVGTAADMVAVHQSGGLRAAAFQYLIELAPQDALPLARDWWGLHDGRGDVARAIMGHHAELQDVDRVREALTVAASYYDQCSLVDALGRLAGVGPFPELDEVYQTAGYSYLRLRAALAMNQTDPRFVSRWAEECLWDCEDATIAIGVSAAPRTPKARHRIEQLAAEPRSAAD